MAEDKTGVLNETVEFVLAGKHPHKTGSSCSMLERYKETPIFIPVDITEDAVELVTRKLLCSLGPGGTDSEVLQGWLLKYC